jgi:hypothetical protein
LRRSRLQQWSYYFQTLVEMMAAARKQKGKKKSKLYIDLILLLAH